MTDMPWRSETNVPRPPATAGFPNGEIPAEFLETIEVRSFVMVEPAAQARRAMAEAAARDGVSLSSTGTYRSRAQQEALFFARFTPISFAQAAVRGFRNCRRYEGQWYVLKPGMALAATPGGSRHGEGLADDVAELNADGAVIPVGAAALEWLAKNGPLYGFWPTVRSELWHWVYMLGGLLPPALEVQVPSPTIKRGSRGQNVLDLRAQLQALGMMPDRRGSTSKPSTRQPSDRCGLKMVRGVRRLQKHLGLAVDGVYGPVTAARLRDLLVALKAMNA